jgi:hypothetical protein
MEEKTIGKEYTENFKWTRHIGHNLIKNVTITFGSEEDPAHPTEEVKERVIYDQTYLDFWYQFRVGKQENEGWNRLMGGG